MSRNPNRGSIRRRYTPRQRQKLLRAYHRSQQTQADFVARHGLGLSTLGKWLREEGQSPPAEEASPVLQEVVVSSSPESKVSVAEIISPQGWTVRFSGNLAPETLRRWLEVLPC